MSKFPFFLFSSLLVSTSAFALTCADGSTGCVDSKQAANDCLNLGYTLDEPDCDHPLLCPFNTNYKVCVKEKTSGTDTCTDGTMTKAECDAQGGTFLSPLTGECGICTNIGEDSGCTLYTKNDCQEWEVKISNSQTLTYYNNCRLTTSPSEAVDHMGDSCIENTKSCDYKHGDDTGPGWAATTGQPSAGAYFGQGGQTWSDPCVGSIIEKFVAPISNDIEPLQSLQSKCTQIEAAYMEAIRRYNKCCYIQYGTKQISESSPFSCDKCKVPSGTSSNCGSGGSEWVHSSGL